MSFKTSAVFLAVANRIPGTKRPRQGASRRRCRTANHPASRGTGVPRESSGSSADNQPGSLDHFQCSGNPTLGVVHRRHKGVEVRWLVEPRLAAVPAIQSVIDHPSDSVSSSLWHPRVVANAILQVKNAPCHPFVTR